MCLRAEDELLSKNKRGAEKSKEQSFVVAELSQAELLL